MLPGLLGHFRIETEGSTDSGVAIRGNGHPDPTTTDKHPSPFSMTRELLGNTMCIVRIISAFIRIGAYINQIVPQLLQMLTNGTFKLKSGVIGSNDNIQRKSPESEWVGSGRILKSN